MVTIQGVTADEWAERYGLRIKTLQCPSCLKYFRLDIPIAIKGYRGFQAPPHECGVRFQAVSLLPVGEEEKKIWLNILQPEK